MCRESIEPSSTGARRQAQNQSISKEEGDVDPLHITQVHYRTPEEVFQGDSDPNGQCPPRALGEASQCSDGKDEYSAKRNTDGFRPEPVSRAGSNWRNRAHDHGIAAADAKRLREQKHRILLLVGPA
jgi:hypothetical protein